MQDDPSLPSLSTTGLRWIGAGISGIVYPLDEHRVVKIAPKFDDCEYSSDEALNDLLIERAVYHRLGRHPRICQYISSVQRGIILERFGEPLRKRLQLLNEQGETPSHNLALKWSYQVADGVAYIHRKCIIQGDIGCHNILVCGDDVKLCDFAGSSIDGKPHTVGYECRSQRWQEADGTPSIQNELFALGSTIYEIWTTRRPYQDQREDMIELNYKNQCFPDVQGLPVGGIILKCWYGTYTSADEVLADLESLRTKPTKTWNNHAANHLRILAIVTTITALIVAILRRPRQQ